MSEYGFWSRRFGLMCVALVALAVAASGGSAAGRSHGGVSPRAAVAGSAYTPVIQLVPSLPRWFEGDDGRVHLEYELLLTNTPSWWSFASRRSRCWAGRAHAAAPRVPASQGQEPDERGGSGVRNKRIWAGLLGLGKAVVEAVELTADGAIVIAVRPRFTQRDRCPHCRRRCPGYDLGQGRRCWRALDLGCAASRSSWCPATMPSGSPGRSPSAAPTP